MSIEDEYNYRGRTIHLVGVPQVMPNSWQAFENGVFGKPDQEGYD